MKKMMAVLAVLVISGAAVAGIQTITEGYKGWGGDPFDFTVTQTVGGVDYFGWDALEITSYYAGNDFYFEISMPRDLTGGDNFDLVIDLDNSKTNTEGDILVHYANDAPVNYWVTIWDAKSYQSGSWVHQDLLPTGVTANQIDAKNYEITVDGGLALTDTISYAWLSPLGDDGFPEGWTGEAVVISTWGDPCDYVEVSVPEPASMALLGLGGFLLRKRK